MRLGHAILGLVTLFASTAHSIVTKPAVRPPVDATAPAPTADPTPTADEVAAPISTASSIDPAQDDVLSRLTQTDALPTSKVTKTGKAGTGQYITVANPFLHARGLFAASLLGSVCSMVMLGGKRIIDLIDANVCCIVRRINFICR